MAKHRVQFTLDETDSQLFAARAVQRDITEGELVAIAIHEYLHGNNMVPSVALHARRTEEAAAFLRDLERIGFTPRKIQQELRFHERREQLLVAREEDEEQ